MLRRANTNLKISRKKARAQAEPDTIQQMGFHVASKAMCVWAKGAKGSGGSQFVSRVFRSLWMLHVRCVHMLMWTGRQSECNRNESSDHVSDTRRWGAHGLSRELSLNTVKSKSGASKDRRALRGDPC